MGILRWVIRAALGLRSGEDEEAYKSYSLQLYPLMKTYRTDAMFRYDTLRLRPELRAEYASGRYNERQFGGWPAYPTVATFDEDGGPSGPIKFLFSSRRLNR